jgi:plastocyanin/uncharacterized membrane protein YozB (DUF420 family)
MNAAPGFIGPFASNVNLAVQLLMGTALLIGMGLARRKRFRAHAICQSAVVLLNFIPIFIFMAPVFHRGVQPALPAGLSDSFFLFPTVHATLATVAELLGLYIILRAGTNLLPQALRFTNYKKWMRAELALWWLVIAFGLGTYWNWYVKESRAAPQETVKTESAATERAGASPGPAPQATPKIANIKVSNFQFEPKELTIEPGTTVVWKNNTGRHTVVADDSGFESSVLAPGEEFRRTFDREGRFPYYCGLHGAAGGRDMAGTIIVAASNKP